MTNRQGYCLPTQAQPDKTAMMATKRLATRYYQLKIGHAVIGTHLKRIKTIEDDRCWWCHSGERQTVKHLFKECHRWREAREELKKTVKRHLWQNEDLKFLFVDRDTTKAILNFLEKTEVGNRTAEKETERREEERDKILGWNEMTRTSEEREEEERMENVEARRREVEEFIAEVLREAEVGGYLDENG